jgi:hypothetical protein
MLMCVIVDSVNELYCDTREQAKNKPSILTTLRDTSKKERRATVYKALKGLFVTESFSME